MHLSFLHSHHNEIISIHGIMCFHILPNSKYCCMNCYCNPVQSITIGLNDSYNNLASLVKVKQKLCIFVTSENLWVSIQRWASASSSGLPKNSGLNMTSLIRVALDLVPEHEGQMVELDWVPGLEGQMVVLDSVPGLQVVVVDPVVLDLHFVLPLTLVVLGSWQCSLCSRRFACCRWFQCRWSFICHMICQVSLPWDLSLCYLICFRNLLLYFLIMTTMSYQYIGSLSMSILYCKCLFSLGSLKYMDICYSIALYDLLFSYSWIPLF